MKWNPKNLITLAATLLGLLAVVLVLVLAEKLLAIWHYLQQAPLWLVFVYATILVFVALFPLWLLLKFNRKKTPEVHQNSSFQLDEQGLNQHLIKEQERGVDTYAAENELSELHKRRDAGLFHLTLFGHASSGKSSLIQALMPEKHIETDVIKGTTTDIHQHQYGQLILADVPGFDAVDQVDLTVRALEEAQRAHVVVFLLDGDLSRTEMNLFHALRQVNKPMVLALNKMDLYDENQKQALTQAIEDKTRSLFPVVCITTGGQEVIRVQQSSGEMVTETRPRASHIKPLIDAIEHETENVVAKISVGKTEIEQGVEMLQQMAEPLTDLNVGAELSLQSLERLEVAVAEQASESEQIERNVKNISSKASDNQSAIDRVTHTTLNLTELAHSLSNQVQQFKLA